MAPKQGLCMSNTTAFKKGWDRPFFGISDGCMLAGVHVLICTHVSEMHGARTRRKHMFLADRAGSSERSSTAAQRKQKRN